jgi:BMFP domain-containing protein YqiC
MLLELRSDLESGARMVNQIEQIRSQLQRLDSAAAKSAAEDLEKKLIDIEDDLIQLKLTGQGQDSVRWPPKLLTKINYLANGLASGDFGPTKQQREVHALFKQQLAELRQRLDKLLADNDVKNLISR